MKKTILSILIIMSFSYGNGCLLVQSGDLNVSWTGYKTIDKIGVSGVFTDIDYRPNQKEGKNFEELFVGSSVAINLEKIDTKNEARDKNLVKNFFSLLAGDRINAKIVAIKADKKEKGKRVYHGDLDVNLTMNNRSRVIPMRYSYHKGKFEAKGTLNIYAFDGDMPLRNLSNSCRKLHKGVTWFEVAIAFNTTIEATLCHVETKGEK